MHAIANACFGDFPDEVVDTGPGAHHPRGLGTRAAQSRRRAVPDFGLQHSADGGGDDAVGAGILGVRRCVDERHPRGIALRGVVAVQVAIADRGDRSPEAVVVLGVEHRDQRVVDSLRDGGVQAGVAGEVAAGSVRDRAYDPGVDRRFDGFPEARDPGLFGAAPRAVLRAERLDLVVVARPLRARQRRRRSGAKLVGTRHQPGFALRPVDADRQRGRHVDAGPGRWAVAFRRDRVVAGAGRQHSSGGLFAEHDAPRLRRAVGNRRQRGLVGATDRGLLRRREFRQCDAVGRSDRGIGRGRGR